MEDHFIFVDSGSEVSGVTVFVNKYLCMQGWGRAAHMYLWLAALRGPGLLVHGLFPSLLIHHMGMKWPIWLKSLYQTKQMDSASAH